MLWQFTFSLNCQEDISLSNFDSKNTNCIFVILFIFQEFNELWLNSEKEKILYIVLQLLTSPFDKSPLYFESLNIKDKSSIWLTNYAIHIKLVNIHKATFLKSNYNKLLL